MALVRFNCTKRSPSLDIFLFLRFFCLFLLWSYKSNCFATGYKLCLSINFRENRRGNPKTKTTVGTIHTTLEQYVYSIRPTQSVLTTFGTVVHFLSPNVPSDGNPCTLQVSVAYYKALPKKSI